ncbi:50S ribosomal protein L2 [Candidatus Saccharibacteria bacterium RIFCSPHIGHO2_12_FULL_47_16b]|nr:MAG: 50S ribosomal protein L2 [Candidatus Saccharibacteria bacterium RIFCSPHIGHO2_12_FULL_47_16b]
MAIREYKPTTPSQRGMSSPDFSEITTKKPLKSLVRVKRASVARNNRGRITTRHRGGGAKRFWRQVNFKLPRGSVATVEQIEYDPNRSAQIARLKDQAGNYHYIIASKGMRVGRQVKVDEEVPISRGNRLPLKNIPTGTTIHAIELTPGHGAQVARGAGTAAQLLAKDGKSAQVRLPSGEIRLFQAEAMASIGPVGNEQQQNVQVGKAGRTRRRGIRPTVRGVVMAAADHPHGGGDGGRHKMARPPTTPWGQKTLGYKTRRRKTTDKYIIRARHEGRRK